MVEITTIRFHYYIVSMAKTDAGEGTLEAGKFLCKGQKGGAPPFKEDVGSEGIFLSWRGHAQGQHH